MVFSSIIFVFLFLPGVMFFYFVIPKKFLGMRNLVLLGFSLFFYFYGEPKYVIIMLASVLMNYIFGLLLGATSNHAKLIVVLCVISNLLILVYFKYLSFITENINSFFSLGIKLPSIIMPIGISFFTFQAMSYVLDVYNKKAKAQKNPLDVALYISMFPQLMAGPIVRYETVA